MNIILPNNWRPRDYQKPLWSYLAKGGQRAVISWHRRSGKDAVMLHHCACAAHERVGNIWYLMPEYGQCRKAMWQAINPHTGKLRLDEAFPHELRETTNQQEMYIKLKNGSMFQLVGSDNYNSLVGSTPIGLVFSEYALSDPSAWSYLRPMLLENKGWAAFNSTPRGKNHFHDMFEMAKSSDGWFAQILTVNDTKLFTDAQMASELREMQAEHGEAVGEAFFKQEYYCSFNVAVIGSYYGREMMDAENTGRICRVPYQSILPVHTAWDLGFTDDTTIWFYQVVGNEVHLIDYYASSGEDPDHYCKKLKEKGYGYGLHWLPHDARAKTLGSGGKSVVEQLAKRLGFAKMRVLPKLSLQDGIQASRMLLKRSYFDLERTREGVKCLQEYQREYDTGRKMLKDKPLHDFTSHGADAFRMLALAWCKEAKIEISPKPESEFIVGRSGPVLDQLWQEKSKIRRY